MSLSATAVKRGTGRAPLMSFSTITMRRRAKLEGKVPKARRSRPQGPAREEGRADGAQGRQTAHEKEPVTRLSLSTKIYGGEGGIRTPGPLQVNGFQDRRDRPLRHLSKGCGYYSIIPPSE